MKNKIGLLGMLGLLGLLGFFTNNPGFYGFFGFFGFFGFSNIIPDEMFKTNINKSARNAFFSSVMVYPIIIIAAAITKSPLVYAFGFAISFALSILTFSISFVNYERKGDI